MHTIQVVIPNMKSSHCQLTVTRAVSEVGALVKSIAPTTAEIELKNNLTSDAVLQAIRRAGYEVSETN